jgi:heterodisulfide reductase subunit C
MKIFNRSKRNGKEPGEDANFLREMASSSEGARILCCIQCGTCSASCPVFEAMDFPPRLIFSMIREGNKQQVLTCVTPWICASCYKCTVNCPAKIKITEVMCRLKRMCIREQIVTTKTDTGRFYAIFMQQVQKFGRTHELGLMLRYMLFHHPLKLLQQVPYGIRMMLAGSLSLFPDRIKNVKVFHSINDHAMMLERA